jgi:hypothetical protein
LKKKYISYWTEVKELYSFNTFVIIYGKYNHKNVSKEGVKCLGVYWSNSNKELGYPNARGVLAPAVLDDQLNEGMLRLILFQAHKEKKLNTYKEILEAIDNLLK